ncbi:hypothetical protein ACFIQF_19505 [Comamonas sp. J-3]
MKLHKLGAALAAALMLSACSEGMSHRMSELADRAKAKLGIGSKPQKAADVPDPQDPLAKLLSNETIGLNLAFLEKQIGPAMRSDNQLHLFKVQGCEVGLRTDAENRVIRAVQVAITPSCDVDVSGLLGLQAPMRLKDLTFGAFDAATPTGQYVADCLRGCGNAYVPGIYLVVEASRAQQNRTVMLSVPMESDAVLTAAEPWIDAMVAKEGEDWVIFDQGFNCTPQKYRSVAAQALAAVKPQLMTFGDGLEYPQCAGQTAAVAAPSAAQASTAVIAIPQPRGSCDMTYDELLTSLGLVPKETLVHGPDEPDFTGFGCPYRITPAPGTMAAKGSAVSFRVGWEQQ